MISQIQNTNEYFFVSCDCGSCDHQMRFTFDKGNGEYYCECGVFLDIFLSQYHNFWGRLWLGIKYIFGYKSSFGHFDCVMMRDQDLVKLKEMIENYMKYKEQMNAKV